MAAARSELGWQGEREAERFLKRLGLKLLERRFSTPVGEIDIIMRAGETLVFVEVKAQRDRRFKDPQEQVTPAKRRRLIKAARWFLERKHWLDRACRFDVVAVVLPAEGAAEIEHFPDAFVPDRW